MEAMASNNNLWSSKRANPKKSDCKYEVDAMTLLLAHILERVGVFPTPGGSSSPSVRVYAICEACGMQGTHLLSATKVLLLLSTLTTCIVSSQHH